MIDEILVSGRGLGGRSGQPVSLSRLTLSVIAPPRTIIEYIGLNRNVHRKSNIGKHLKQ